MSKPSQSKYKHIFQNKNIKRKKSKKKYKKAVNWFIRVMKRIGKEGETPVLVNEKKKVLRRIVVMGISDEQITNALQHKGLNDLVANTYHS